MPADVITVLGIDQGLVHCGYAVVRVAGSAVTLLETGIVNLDTKRGREAMRTVFARSAGEHACGGYATEKPWRGQHVGQSPVVGMRIHGGQRRILGMLAEMAEAVHLRRLGAVPPTSAKLALSGYGQASKELMIRAAQIRFGVVLTEHEADACGIALAALGRTPRTRLTRTKEKTLPGQVGHSQTASLIERR